MTIIQYNLLPSYNSSKHAREIVIISYYSNWKIACNNPNGILGNSGLIADYKQIKNIDESRKMYAIIHWCEYHLDNCIVVGGKGWPSSIRKELNQNSSIASVVTVFSRFWSARNQSQTLIFQRTKLGRSCSNDLSV